MARGCTLNRILSFPSKVGSHESNTNYILSDKLQNLGVQVTATFSMSIFKPPFAFKDQAVCVPIALRIFIRPGGEVPKWKVGRLPAAVT